MLPLLAAPAVALTVLAALAGPAAPRPPAPPVPSSPPAAASPAWVAPAATPGDGTVGTRGWVAPVAPPLVLRGYDPPTRDWLPGHRGVDLVADPGDEVRAAGPGTVTWAGPLAGRGVVVVVHPDGRRTSYEPVEPEVLVGDEVAAGDVLGRLATGSGHCGGVPSCLHWGLRRGEDYLDPLLLLRRGRPVLLP